MKCHYPHTSFSEGAERVLARVLEKNRDHPDEPDIQILASADALSLLLVLAQDDAAVKTPEWPAVGLDSMKSLLNIEQLPAETYSKIPFISAKDVVDRAAAMAWDEMPEFDSGEKPCDAEIARRHLLAACIECRPVMCQALLGIRGEPEDIVKKLTFPFKQPQPEATANKLPNIPIPFTMANPAAFSQPMPNDYQFRTQHNQAFLDLCCKLIERFPSDTFSADWVITIANKFWSAACEKNKPATPQPVMPTETSQ